MNVDIKEEVTAVIAELKGLREENERRLADSGAKPGAPERPAQLERLCSGVDALVLQLIGEGIPPVLVIFMVTEHMKAMAGYLQERLKERAT